MFYFLKKIKTNIWRYHYFTPVYQKSWWYDLQFLRYRAWQTEIGNFGSFLPFYLPKKPTIQNFEMKELARDIILHMCTKNHNHMRYSFWDTESEGQIFFVILGHCFFLLPAPHPPPHPTTQKIKTLKKWKSIWRCHHFAHVYQKSQSHDVCFLRYGVQQTAKWQCFVILGHFWPFTPLAT